jgi:hypothetical protein
MPAACTGDRVDHGADEGLSVPRGAGCFPRERACDGRRPLFRARLAAAARRRVGLQIRRAGVPCRGKPRQHRRSAVHESRVEQW